MKSTELLNEVKNMLVEFANNNGICLKSEFGTVAEFKKFVISFTFTQLLDLGIETKDAYDMVMGFGEYDRLADMIWEAAQ